MAATGLEVFDTTVLEDARQVLPAEMRDLWSEK